MKNTGSNSTTFILEYFLHSTYLQETRISSVPLINGTLYRISPKSVTKCGNGGKKFIFSTKQIMSPTARMFLKFKIPQQNGNLYLRNLETASINAFNPVKV